MKVLSAFFRLIRWPNLVFIALTQCLFFYCVFHSLFTGPVPEDSLLYFHFTILVIASILIAAAGYIINDYFDMHIDAINKPDKVVVDKVVRRRWAILLHLILSFIGIAFSLYFSWKTANWIIAAGNIVCVILLWFYSTTFKKKLLIGNVIIAALTAWVIFVIFFAFNYGHYKYWGHFNPTQMGMDVRKLFKFTILYAGFAFIVSLIREVVKDLEDMEGDAKYNCRTMPVVWGVPAAKVFVAVWLVVCIASLVIVEVYAWKLGWIWSTIYGLIFIILPMIACMRLLQQAVSPKDYHRLSNLVKFIMLAGILSMLFFI